MKKVLPKSDKKCARIVMPLQKGAENYLNLALNKIKKDGMIHFYSFSESDKYDKITVVIEKE